MDSDGQWMDSHGQSWTVMDSGWTVMDSPGQWMDSDGQPWTVMDSDGQWMDSHGQWWTVDGHGHKMVKSEKASTFHQKWQNALKAPCQHQKIKKRIRNNPVKKAAKQRTTGGDGGRKQTQKTPIFELSRQDCIFRL